MVTFHTNHGDIVIKTFDDKAPETVKNFLDYCREGFYDNTIFHRVINGFMIQGGGFEPGMNQKTTKSPIQNEANNGLKNTRGTLAMARTQAPHSATAQFFINVADNDFLNFSGESLQGWGYCVFAEVVEGMDVVDKIKSVSTAQRHAPGCAERRCCDQKRHRQRVIRGDTFYCGFASAIGRTGDYRRFSALFTGEARRRTPCISSATCLKRIGDDDPNPLHQQIASALKALADSGVPCYFIHGNRDFLVGKRFAPPKRDDSTAGRAASRSLRAQSADYARRYPAPTTQAIWRFARRFTTLGPARSFLALPLFIRRRIAAKMRADSKAANSSKSMDIMDVNRRQWLTSWRSITFSG